MVINPKTKKPISPVTLRKYFREELDRGLTVTKMRVGGALVRSALGVAPTEHHAGYAGNVTAQIFYLKTQAGWKEADPAAPPPPPPEQDEQGRLEIARRIAFTLVHGARTAPPKALAAPKATPQKRSPVRA